MANNTIEAVEIPMPLDTLIKVGMLADIEGHGAGLVIERISITLCPRRDAAAEGTSSVLIRTVGVERQEEIPATAVEVEAIEAALLPYAVFDFGKGGWGYGRQLRRVYEAGE